MSALAAHLAHAFELHRRWCRDNGTAIPSELTALVGAITSSQERSSADLSLEPGDDAGVPLAHSYSEAARLLEVSVSTIARMVDDGRLNAIAIGRNKRIPTSELHDFIANQLDRTGPTAC